MDERIAPPLCDCADGPSACPRPFCPYYHYTIELIGRRWTGSILRAMLRGVSRFGDIRATIPDISDRMLSERLKELEAEGIVVRHVIPDTPVRIEYQLTTKGHALETIVTAALAWADRWLTGDTPTPPR
ncbi:MAG TPA: helix-turn-helix domain-containing protein [Ktedonobacterales bacterium]